VRWNLDFEQAGDYELWAYIPGGRGKSTQARYEIHHAGQTDVVTRDQTSAADDWLSLGTFSFTASGDQSVALADNTGEPYTNADGVTIAFDALRIRPAAGPGNPDAGPGTTDGGPTAADGGNTDGVDAGPGNGAGGDKSGGCSSTGGGASWLLVLLAALWPAAVARGILNICMGNRTGRADLPLHGGRVPAWLSGRMSRLGRVIVEAIACEYGRAEVLRRLSHPFWFQSFGAVMGMDWHSSGITTSVVGALKRGLEPVRWELGIHVCGGRGKQSRKTPAELVTTAERVGFDGNALTRCSRLVAKVDNAAVHDGFQIYLHSFVVTDEGDWAVVQQGMSPERKLARRYHWLSTNLRSFVDDPHAAIDGEPNRSTIINLADHRAAASRDAQVELVNRGPDAVLPHLHMPGHHDMRQSNVVMSRLRGALTAAADRAPVDFAELLLTPGVGRRTVESLALAAEVIYGAPHRFSDPARFSYAHGGKDGHPFPVPLRVYDKTIGVLRAAVDRAELGNDDKLAAIKRLDREARRAERVARTGVSFDELIARERARSHRYGGRTVFGPTKPPRDRPEPQAKPQPRQLDLFSDGRA